MNETKGPRGWKLEELEERFREIANSKQVPVAKLGLFATAAMTHLTENEHSFTSPDATFLKSLNLQEERGWYSRVARLFGTTLDEARSAGAIRAIDTQKVGRMFLDAILSLMTYRAGSTSRDEIENDVRILMDLYLNGLMIRY